MDPSLVAREIFAVSGKKWCGVPISFMSRLNLIKFLVKQRSLRSVRQIGVFLSHGSLTIHPCLALEYGYQASGISARFLADGGVSAF